VSELANLSRNTQVFPSGWRLHFTKLKKNSTSKNNHLEINVFSYPETVVCPIICLKDYIERSNSLVTLVENIFITLTPPYRASKPNTLAKHLKEVLSLIGVDTDSFKAPSYWSASTSKALAKGVSTDLILSRATWASEKTFCKFYAKDITSGKVFSDSVLSI
jgi:hypothetical protein